ncbi:alanine--tRNA ligase-related protein [Longispora albida]|uniref:alanine--tRNA ligase-related protein n=1 Tax=Longispora albida TaxID=203523 RepID=UPI00037DE398|nr:alanine--tRNA ligase-related protein [Longispora albida]
MRTSEIRDTFLQYFRERGHQPITGSTLIPPPGDPVLFTTSGMHPLTPYLEGQRHPLGRRLVNVQRCLRTTDLDEVGDRTHLTVFEMLGSWSLGDYDGPQSLRWGYELLRDGFGIPESRLHVTVFGGEERLGLLEPDSRSLGTWRELGVPVELTGEDNWWSNGPTGPCGPDSEIFVWTGEGTPVGTPGTDSRWVEVWNHVSMRYERRRDHTLHPLRQSNVDTGMGLERLMMVLGGKSSVYECDVFEPWTRTVSQLWPGLGIEDFRVVCDHLRSSVVVCGDGITPSNTGRGYVLRRLVRRLLTVLWRHDPGLTLGDLPDEPGLETLGHFGQPREWYPIREVLVGEERRFRSLLDRGRPVVSRLRRRGELTGGDFEYLRDTHGLPRDLVEELLLT